MAKQVIIGFCGPTKSGKSTAAKFLEIQGFMSVGFADRLKRDCKTIFDFSEEQLWGDLKDLIDDRYGLTPRYVMQKYGTDFMREMVDDQWWVHKCIATIMTGLSTGARYSHIKGWVDEPIIYPPYNGAVITDVRFGNEIAAIKKAGGYVIRLLRADNATHKHKAEAASTGLPVDMFDLVIDNRDIDITDLGQQVINFYRSKI